MLNTYNNNNKVGHMKNKTERIFVYINSHAAHFVDKPPLKNFLNNKIGHKQWTALSDVMMPEILKEDYSMMTENFFHGITAYQYTLIHKGGTFINPLLYGLTQDVMMWSDIVHAEPDFYQDIIYIDVPYEIYEEVAKNDPYFVDEETYKTSSKNIQTIVNGLKTTYYSSNTILH